MFAFVCHVLFCVDVHVYMFVVCWDGGRGKKGGIILFL